MERPVTAVPGPPATIDRKPLPSITQMTQETSLTAGTAMTVALALMEEGYAYTVPGRGKTSTWTLRSSAGPCTGTPSGPG
jgi:hypothetical protein